MNVDLFLALQPVDDDMFCVADFGLASPGEPRLWHRVRSWLPGLVRGCAFVTSPSRLSAAHEIAQFYADWLGIPNQLISDETVRWFIPPLDWSVRSDFTYPAWAEN